MPAGTQQGLVTGHVDELGMPIQLTSLRSNLMNLVKADPTEPKYPVDSMGLGIFAQRDDGFGPWVFDSKAGRNAVQRRAPRAALEEFHEAGCARVPPAVGGSATGRARGAVATKATTEIRREDGRRGCWGVGDWRLVRKLGVE